MAAWSGTSTNWYAMEPIGYEIWNPTYYPGLDLTSAAWGGSSSVGTQANWEYWVPRYREDVARYGEAPSTGLYSMFTEGVLFLPYEDTSNYPALVNALVNTQYGWEADAVHYGGQGEMDSSSNQFSFTNEYEEHGDKGADMNLVTYEAENPPKRRDTYMADAYIYLVDEDAPRFTGELKASTNWLNTTAVPISYEAEDKGLTHYESGLV